MDQTLRIALAVFLAVFLRHGIAAGWAAYKRRQERRGIPLRMKRGVYVPGGHVALIEQVVGWAAWFALACFIASMFVGTYFIVTQ